LVGLLVGQGTVWIMNAPRSRREKKPRISRECCPGPSWKAPELEMGLATQTSGLSPHEGPPDGLPSPIEALVRPTETPASYSSYKLSLNHMSVTTTRLHVVGPVAYVHGAGMSLADAVTPGVETHLARRGSVSGPHPYAQEG
jgi:hypothetical protein